MLWNVHTHTSARTHTHTHTLILMQNYSGMLNLFYDSFTRTKNQKMFHTVHEVKNWNCKQVILKKAVKTIEEK